MVRNERAKVCKVVYGPPRRLAVLVVRGCIVGTSDACTLLEMTNLPHDFRQVKAIQFIGN